jgi:hypothetical protein
VKRERVGGIECLQTINACKSLKVEIPLIKEYKTLKVRIPLTEECPSWPAGDQTNKSPRIGSSIQLTVWIESSKLATLIIF